MFDELEKMKGSILLGRYNLINIDISSLLLYSGIYFEIFGKVTPNFFVSIYFFDLEDKKELEVMISVVKEKLEVMTNQEHNNLKQYLLTFFKEFDNTLGKRLKSNNRLYLIYIFFTNYIDKESIIRLCNDEKSKDKNENIEPNIIHTNSKKILFQSDRSLVVKKDKKLIRKSINWINSIHGISKEDIFINSILLLLKSYIFSIHYENEFSYEMPYFKNEKKARFEDIIDSLIRLNMNTYIGEVEGLSVGAVQEDPNKDNFVANHEGINIYDFDSVTTSFLILQPIYVFINYIIENYGEDDMNESYLKNFEYIIFKFSKFDLFVRDSKSIGIKELFLIFEKVFTIGLEKNSFWTKISLRQKNFFNSNKKKIILILYKYLNG